MTPEYLKQIGLIDSVPPPSADIGLLLNRALEKVAFLPFGLMIDKWRWEVFSGQISPADYNKSLVGAAARISGHRASGARTEADFDPGANIMLRRTCRTRDIFWPPSCNSSFTARCAATAGYNGPLNRCSIYGNKAAGEKLNKMLEMGESRPWPEALEALTGEKEMDATAMLDYFAPLKNGWTSRIKGTKSGGEFVWRAMAGAARYLARRRRNTFHAKMSDVADSAIHPVKSASKTRSHSGRYL